MCDLNFRIKLGEKQYMEAFNSELDAFKERITNRAKEKLQKAMEEYEEVCTDRIDHVLFCVLH
jgi:2-oxo-4-hydroxy-4-carboxy--5-ureidoimidazoline (OHCU) decarboxylase